MKISIVGTRGIPANYGGFETYAENLSVALSALGHEVTVTCPGRSKYATPLPVNLKSIRRLFIYDVEKLVRGRYLKAMATIIYDLVSLVACVLGSRMWCCSADMRRDLVCLYRGYSAYT